MIATLSLVLLWLADALAVIMLARCLLQYARLHIRHPLAAFLVAGSDWLVRPLRRIVPPVGLWDTACVAAALLVYLMAYGGAFLLALPDTGFSGRVLAVYVLSAALSVSKAAAYVILAGLFWRAILSFAHPYSPLMPVLQRLFQPLCRPFAFLRFGRWDFSGSVLALLAWWWAVWSFPQLLTQIMHIFLQ